VFEHHPSSADKLENFEMFALPNVQNKATALPTMQAAAREPSDASLAVDWSYIHRSRRQKTHSISSTSLGDTPHQFSHSQERLLPKQPSTARQNTREQIEHLVRPASFQRWKDDAESLSPKANHLTAKDYFKIEPQGCHFRSNSDVKEIFHGSDSRYHSGTRIRHDDDISRINQSHRKGHSILSSGAKGSHHGHEPIARNWRRTKKRVTALIACANTSIIGFMIGIYVRSHIFCQDVSVKSDCIRQERYLQFNISLLIKITLSFSEICGIIIFSDKTIYHLTFYSLFIGLAASTFCAWPLPLLHGRKPYLVTAFALALPLELPQGIMVGQFRSPETPKYRIGLLFPRALAGLAVGLANINCIATLFDLFGASLMSTSPHGELVLVGDIRRHGGGIGVWLGIWVWCFTATVAIGFLIGAGIVNSLNPVWGFYMTVILLAATLVINAIVPETRRASRKRSYREIRDVNVACGRIPARGEVKFHLTAKPPKHWYEEMVAGIHLNLDMLSQPGFLVLALYLGWIYAQIILVIVVSLHVQFIYRQSTRTLTFSSLPKLLGALLSREYRWPSPSVGAGVFGIAIGALLAVPLTKAGLFSRARRQGPRTDSFTVRPHFTWTSHLVRRILFTAALPFVGLAYTVSSAGKKVHFVVPILFAALIGFLSNLAMTECYGLIMETFDTCDLQPGVNSGQRLRSVATDAVHRRTNYSSFPRVCAGIFSSQAVGFLLAAVATTVGGAMTRRLGAQLSTGITAAILLLLTSLLIGVLWRVKSVQVIPDSAVGAWRKSVVALEQGRFDEWKPIVIGNPSGKVRKMNLLELGTWSRWSEIRRLNRLTGRRDRSR
jgi:hypothetical protein